MNEAEMKKEVMTDMVNTFSFSDRMDKKFRRLVIKSSRFPVYSVFEYRSPKKNRWIVFFEARSKKEFGDNSRVTFVCTYESKNGLHAIMFTNTNNKAHLIVYPPHFFSRYANRMNIELTGIELIKQFFKYNNSYVYDIVRKKLDENTYMDECRGSGLDGISLGFLTTEGNVLFKTFITYDMLKGEQISKFTENEKIRREIHD